MGMLNNYNSIIKLDADLAFVKSIGLEDMLLSEDDSVHCIQIHQDMLFVCHAKTNQIY